jgi:hypothetical protein
MMNPVPIGAFNVASAGAAAPVPSDAASDDPPEDSEPPHAATLNTAPRRTVTLKPLSLKVRVLRFGEFIPHSLLL